MSEHSDPPRDSPDWEHPDFCPFCRTRLTNGGAGFIDHLEDAPACKERFETWRERVVEDISGEWGG